MDPNLSQALHLINGTTVNNKIRQGGLIPQLFRDQKKPPAEIINELYLRCFCRKPTESEVNKLVAVVTAEPADKQMQALEDVFWGLLNSREFLFNH